jgi:endonuclease YncB( thermonuclease family)
LVLGKKVLLFKGNKDRDSFGRSLRYVVLAENSIFINQYLVENGFAKVYEKYIEDNIESVYIKLQESELEAKQNNIGRWVNCKS